MALAALRGRTGQQLFTVREVYAEMVAAGTSYAEPTVFKTDRLPEFGPERVWFSVCSTFVVDQFWVDDALTRLVHTHRG
jgi:hypothetical protein